MRALVLATLVGSSLLVACGDGDGSGATGTGAKNANAAPKIEIVDAVPPATKGTEPPGKPNTASSFEAAGPRDLDQPLRDVAKHLFRTWKTNFRESGLKWQRPDLVIEGPGEQVPSNCGPAGDPSEFQEANPGFFCIGTDEPGGVKKPTIYLSDKWLYENVYFQRDSLNPADFAVAFVVAHETGHHIQDRLGYINQKDGSLCCGLATNQVELQADCLGGVWAKAAYYDGLLEDNDIEEAARGIAALGDYELFAEGHHGIPGQRKNAMTYGYNSGNPADCTLDLSLLPEQTLGEPTSS